jgi:hypothetical protein
MSAAVVCRRTINQDQFHKKDQPMPIHVQSLAAVYDTRSGSAWDEWSYERKLQDYLDGLERGGATLEHVIPPHEFNGEMVPMMFVVRSPERS